MATRKVKRSVHKKQSAQKRLVPSRKLIHFPHVNGKILEDVEFSSASDDHNISINFQDKTALNFSIETGLILKNRLL